jgi:riboflavin synthase alpha subunit
MPDLSSMFILPIILTVVIGGISLVVTLIIIGRVRGMVNGVVGSVNQMNVNNAQILASGEPAQATVLQIWEAGMTVNNNPMIGISLQVQPMNRPAYQVQLQTMISRLKLSQVQPGSVVNVRIDPIDTNKVALMLM